MDMAARPARAQILRSGLRFRRAGRYPEARARISRKMEFLEISEILSFGVDVADSIFRNSMIFVKHMGRYGYGGPPDESPDPEVWAQNNANTFPEYGILLLVCNTTVANG